MTRQQRLLYLIDYLIKEDSRYINLEIPATEAERKRLLRSLMNVRPPRPVSPSFLKIQDEYLSEETDIKQVVSVSDLSPVEPGIYLWQGDITRLRADAIVNAANSALLGCFVPCHGCIDNAIHSAAGVQLRLECHRLMEKQGEAEPVGTAKITPAFNLPCSYILHTVGPVVSDAVTQKERALLASCYHSCMAVAESHGLKNLVFCCISTGEFHFPNELAAQIAVDTVRKYRREHDSGLEVVFNVFKDNDYEIYRRLLGTGAAAV